VEQVRELAVETLPAPPPGVGIRLADEADLEGIYAAAIEATPDMAMDAAISAAPYERWLVQHARSTFHVALEHELTGVLRSRRRRGIARALKQTQIAWAGAEGYRRLITGTQAGNAAMRTLNLQLGYRERLASIAVKGSLH
jgi:GNAT superfamily N-acetyltransferase